jgi:predicted permease
MQASRRDVVSALKQTSAGSAGGNRSAWSKRNLLLSAQLASCLILLVGAGLLFRGVWQSAKVDPGFPVDRLAGVVIDTHVLAPTETGRARLLRQVVDRIEALPEVASVAWADRFPFLGHGTGGFVNEHGARVRCLFNVVSNRYFETLGLPLLAGRDFSIEEVESRAHVVVVSDLAARRAWPGQDPIGRQIHELDWVDRGKTRPEESFTVIGVVKSVRSTYLSKPDEAFLYLPRPLAAASGSLLVRTRTAPDRALRSAFGALSSIDPSLPSQATMFTMTDGPVQIQRMMARAPATVAVILGSLALVLASVGILGLVSQLVTRRTREIAIRVSLGAQEREVIGLVLRQTLRPVILGAAAGLAGAMGLSALLASMVAIPEMPDLTYGAGAFSPATFIGALAVLLMVILAASCLPLYRAARIEPAEALRNE